MKHFVYLVEDDIEPSLVGPFATDELRDEKAKELKEKHGDESGIFWLNISQWGVPETGPYSGGFFQVAAGEGK